MIKAEQPSTDLGTGEDTRQWREAHGARSPLEHSCRVLIVEDEVIIGFEVESMVKSLGHSVVAMARNESEAVRLGRKLQPDLILMDVRLGRGSDGIDAAKRILQRRAIPIIFCTGYSRDQTTMERICKLGSFDVLVKPFTISELNKALSRTSGRDLGIAHER
jgi:CheY-like chemotaxis protein